MPTGDPPLCTCGRGPTTTVGAPGPCPLHAFTQAWEHVGLEWADQMHAMDVKSRHILVIGESSSDVSLREIINQVLGATQTDAQRDPAEYPDDSEGIGPLDRDLDLSAYESPRAPNRAMRRAKKKANRG